MKSYGAGSKLVLLHGFLEHSVMWEHFVPTLAKNFTVITIDLPGHGKTHDLAKKSDCYAMRDIALWLKEVLPVHEKIHLVGHSMGGYIALAYAKLFPDHVHKLGLFFSTPLQDDLVKKEQRLKAIQLATQNKTAFIKAAIPMLFGLDNPEGKAKAVMQAESCTITSVKRYLNGMRERPCMRAFINESKVNFGIIAGTNDSAAPPELYKNQIEPNFYKEFNCGHMGHYELPTKTLNALDLFLLH